jgi:hypothetical protein
MEGMESRAGCYAKTARKLSVKKDHTSRLHGVRTQNTTIWNNDAGYVNAERLMKSLYIERF